MQTITINDQDYNVKFSFKAIKNFEYLTNKPITKCIDTWDNLTFFYSCLMASNDSFKMPFNEFTDYLDEHPDLLVQFQTADILGGQDKDQAPEKATKKKHSLKLIFMLWMLLPLFAVSPVLVPIIFIIAWILTNIWLLARLIKTAGNKLGLSRRRSVPK